MPGFVLSCLYFNHKEASLEPIGDMPKRSHLKVSILRVEGCHHYSTQSPILELEKQEAVGTRITAVPAASSLHPETVMEVSALGQPLSQAEAPKRQSKSLSHSSLPKRTPGLHPSPAPPSNSIPKGLH